jgi:hypothetical protein
MKKPGPSLWRDRAWLELRVGLRLRIWTGGMLVNCGDWLRLFHAETCGHDLVSQHRHRHVLLLGGVVELRDEGTGQFGRVMTSAHDGPPVVVGENKTTRHRS